jgi:hypothetical protein
VEADVLVALSVLRDATKYRGGLAQLNNHRGLPRSKAKVIQLEALCAPIPIYSLFMVYSSG